jgi:iron complex outermembrane recepter protein
MRSTLPPQLLCAVFALATLAQLACWPAYSQTSQTATLPTVVIKGSSRNASPDVAQRRERDIAPLRADSNDSARLLEAVPGVDLYEAGGLSRLPSIRGMADDRLRVLVNGADLMAACPNHMNSALSYIAPAAVSSIRVYQGITPVSVGGDSLGGTIMVESARPRFSAPGEAPLAQGSAGAFYRSNGNARGGQLSASLGMEHWSLSYSGQTGQSDNFRAAKGFKPAAPGTEGGPLIPADEVASSAYHFLNHELGVAWRQGPHLLRADLSQQRVFFEGFPNQRMDMTGNHNALLNLRYQGVFEGAEVEASLYRQYTRHKMDMGPDRYQYGTGMPMDTRADTLGGKAQVSWPLATEGQQLRVGTEWQFYTLYDWWPPVGGSMGPNALWNVDQGRRNKLDAYVEWDAQWQPAWFTQIGLRHSTVVSDAAAVQGYDNGAGALWGADAAAFNQRDHHHRYQHWDASALLRYTPDASQTVELGLARKTRSPSVYQLYPWSTQAMAALMNNFVGDGNGYIGNEALRPEVAHTVSATSEWREPEAQRWSFKISAHLSEVQDYIDAQRCTFGQCGADNATRTDGFVLLQYVNQSARLYGLELSGEALLANDSPVGKLTLSGALNALHGENRSTGDGLYHTMPINLRMALQAQRGPWTHTAELKWVGAKTRVSQVRNEMPTDSHSLLNLRTSHEWTKARLDLSLENALDTAYEPPLGGAYVGQGASMTTQGIPWGTAIPGPGRSLNLALTLRY